MRDLGERQIGNGVFRQGDPPLCWVHQALSTLLPGAYREAVMAEHELQGRPCSKRLFPSGLWIKGLSHLLSLQRGR